MALTNLGLALQNMGRVQDAITACQTALALFRETGDRHSEAMALANLGLALHVAGQFDNVITAWQEAADIFREVTRANEAIKATADSGPRTGPGPRAVNEPALLASKSFGERVGVSLA